ncbi:unnamed protein product, partial [marine sediment metagenome]
LISAQLNKKVEKSYIWVTVPSYNHTSYCVTIKGRAANTTGRIYLWIGNTSGQDLYNRKAKLGPKNNQVTAYFRNHKENMFLIGLCFYGCKEGDQCSLTGIDISVKKTGEVVYTWGNDYEPLDELSHSIQEPGCITFGKEIYTATGNIDHVESDNGCIITFNGSKTSEPPGVKTIIATNSRSKYRLCISGKTTFTKGGSLYLWAGGLNGKMVHFKPFMFEYTDSMGIGRAEIEINTRRFKEMKLAIYYRGHITVGDGFTISNIDISQVNGNGP